MSIRLRTFFLLSAFLSILVNTALADISENMDRASAWLISQQQIEGDFLPSELANNWQVNSEVIKALSLVGMADDIDQAVVRHMNALTAVETELLSIRIQIKSQFGLDNSEDFQSLLLRQNPDGGFGSEVGFDSSSYDTLYALLAFAQQPDEYISFAFKALEYLSSEQNSDGSYQFKGNSENISDALTARVMTAYAPYLLKADIGNNIRSLQEYLVSRLRSDSYEIWQLALILSSVIPYTADAAIYDNALNMLLDAQRGDGSWGQDTYTTALAFQALYFSNNINSIIDPAVSILKGRVLVQEQAAEGVSILLVNQSTESLTDENGYFIFNNVTPGSFEISYALSGYITKSQSGSIQASQLVNVGTITLTEIPDTGIVSGNITSIETGEPLAGVNIQLVAADSTLSTVTDAAGYYRIVASPGEVTLTASLAGYLSLTGSATLQAGRELGFSPSLAPEDNTPQVVTLQGQVVDSSDGSLIAGAQIVVSDGSSLVTTNGEFVISDIPLGQITVRVSAENYHESQATVVTDSAGIVMLGDIPLVADSEEQTFAMVSGVIASAEDRSPISGAQLTFSGSVNENIQTSADGSFSLEIEPGELVITVAADGYVGVSSSLQMSAGDRLTFSPLLPKEPEQTVTLTGVVVDDLTGDAVTGALVNINNGAYSAESGATGFIIADLPVGEFGLVITADGYQSIQGRTLALQPGTVELGELRLLPQQQSISSSITGVVTDVSNGVAIAGASITITQLPDPEETDPVVLEQEPQIIELSTDELGIFIASEIDFLHMEVFVQASGYLSNVRQLSLAEHGRQNLQVDLSQFSAGNIEITELGIEGGEAYPAYSEVPFSLELTNRGSIAQRVALIAELIDPQNQVVQQLHIGLDSDSTGSPEPITLLPETPVTVSSQWFTGTYASGSYAILVSAYDAMTNQIVAQKQTAFSVEKTQKLQGVDLLVTPRISRVGADEVVELAATFRYDGNVDSEYTFAYQLVGPDDATVISGSKSITLSPADTSKTLILADEAITFESSGRYLLQAQVAGVSSDINSGWIVVAPSTRIEVSQELTPESVMPGNDRTIHVEILLQGVEQE